MFKGSGPVLFSSVTNGGFSWRESRSKDIPVWWMIPISFIFALRKDSSTTLTRKKFSTLELEIQVPIINFRRQTFWSTRLRKIENLTAHSEKMVQSQLWVSTVWKNWFRHSVSFFLFTELQIGKCDLNYGHQLADPEYFSSLIKKAMLAH